MPSDSLRDFRQRQQDVRELVGEALSIDPQQLDAEIAQPIGATLDGTDKVFIYVSRQMGAKRRGNGISEVDEKLNTGLALIELRRRDDLGVQDPDDRLTDGYRRWLLKWASEQVAHWDERDSGPER